MRCRLCGEKDLSLVIDLGNVPLANSFLDSPDSPEELFPLSLYFCPVCSLVQISEIVDPEKLFREYSYFSSVSNSMQQHAKSLVDSLVKERHLGKDSFVVEVASNDGYLLKHFIPYGIQILGVDPAFNMAQAAIKQGVPTLTEFFDDGMADGLPKADVVIALNVFAHIPDPVSFAHGINRVLKPNGVAVIEIPSVRPIIDEASFDTIYHEHTLYWSLPALKNLCKWAQLTIARVEPIKIHGGGYRLYLTHEIGAYDRPTNRQFEIELALGLNKFPYYQCFANRVRDNITLYKNLMGELRRQGKRIIGYGAAAKGVMMLNALGLDSRTVEYVVDATPIKQNKFMPGSHIPIVPPERFGEPDVAWVLSWNWFSEVQSKHPDFKGAWLTLLPKIEFH